MAKRTRPYRESLLEDLQSPGEAAEYLNAALEDSDEMFLVALRDVAEAKRMTKIACQVGVARETLYRMLSRRGNPTYSNLAGLLNALGLRMRLEPVSEAVEQAMSETLTDSPIIAETLMSETESSERCIRRRKNCEETLFTLDGVVGAEVIPGNQWTNNTVVAGGQVFELRRLKKPVKLAVRNKPLIIGTEAAFGIVGGVIDCPVQAKR
jgi:probable addiction module antidote protein